ncbi:MAG: hypothetical protein KGL39_38435 [Patescibacteria group bacterium]|nr:hypothetical protein [Patescibacteria group bacterium]
MDTRHTSYDDLQRSLGRMEGHQNAMESRMDRLEQLVKDGFEKLEESVKSIHDDVADLKIRDGERKGTWKAIAAFAAAVGTVVGFIVEWVANRGHL